MTPAGHPVELRAAQPPRSPLPARIKVASAYERGGYGTEVTRVHRFIRAPKLDPRRTGGKRAPGCRGPDRLCLRVTEWRREMANYHVTVQGTDRQAMADLVRVHGLRVYPQTLREVIDGERVSAVADEEMIRRLRVAGYLVDEHEDVDEDASSSLDQVGRGNRFREDTEN